MLAELRRYYDSLGIGAERFACPRFPRCSEGAVQFTTAKEAFVGTEYERGAYPRLLFLSLDSGSADSNPTNRTLQAVRRHEMAERVDLLPRGRHWYVTHEMTWVLLRSFVPGLTVETTSAYFAHVNSAKCCMNKAQRRQADDRLFDNCRSYIPGELAVLKPDVIVSQGTKAHSVIRSGLTTILESRTVVNGVACDMAIVSCGGKQVLWLPTHHPSGYGSFWPQRTACWDAYARAVETFVRSGKLPAVGGSAREIASPAPRLVPRPTRQPTAATTPAHQAPHSAMSAPMGTARSIEQLLKESRVVTSEQTFHAFIAEWRRSLPGARSKHAGVLTGQGVQQFQNWQLDVNPHWKLTDAQLLAVMRVEFPLAEGKVFTGSLQEGLKNVSGIRAHYNRDGHHGPSPASRGMSPSISYGKI
jgi:hypothetical protein